MKDEMALYRDFEGIWTPRDIYLRRDIAPLEKYLLSEINSLDQGKGCFASDDYLADFLQTSRSNLGHMLTNLRKKGLVKTIAFDGRKRFLRTIFSRHLQSSFAKNGKAELPNSAEHPCQKRQTYNKAIEKKINATPQSVRRNGFPSLSLEIEDTSIQKLELSTPVKQFHKFAVKEGYHVHSKNGATQNTIYKKGACNGGWKRPMLAKWESAYQGLKERIQDAKRIQRTLDWYIANYDHPFTPVCQTFLTFAERFDQIDKARRREQKDKTPFRIEHRNGEHKKQSTRRGGDPRGAVISEEDIAKMDEWVRTHE